MAHRDMLHYGRQLSLFRESGLFVGRPLRRIYEFTPWFYTPSTAYSV